MMAELQYMPTGKKPARPCGSVFILLATAVLGACASARPSSEVAKPYDPSVALDSLFHVVQMAGIFPDSKTFVDARPRLPPLKIIERYQIERTGPAFDLREFVTRHFELPQPVLVDFRPDTTRSLEAHIRALWPLLTRMPDHADGSSLIPLPQSYVVPGGRFREVYYWDSYFTMLGLIESGRTYLVRAMLDNFAHLIRTFGHIPNGNRTYYLSRSQPPYFGAMVSLYALATDTTKALPYLEALEQEHTFWMSGSRAVALPSGDTLNRYWDERADPRPESYREDYTNAQRLAQSEQAEFYRNVRASAESGWDFSSRWMRDTKDLRTLETTHLVPIDLNSLLYHTEQTIAALRAYRNGEGDAAVAARFRERAAARRRALLAAAYDSATGFFYDVRWRTGERVTDRPTMAAAALLYFGLATDEQARAVAERLQRDFLKPGGFVTTLEQTEQQWDAPNGWAPLVWLGIQGLCRYNRPELAGAARERWLALIRRTYLAEGKLVEKYDVINIQRAAGGGEYPTQDGFGWTNGVALALITEPQTCRAAV